jgi:hypothetical protein
VDWVADLSGIHNHKGELIMQWDSLNFWKEKAGGTISVELYFNESELNPRSIFIWTEMTMPMPSGSTVGSWLWFPEPKALVGYLKHVLFPSYFGIWLVREEWDTSEDEFLPVEKMLDDAEKAAECRYKQDIPLMREIIKDFDKLFDQEDRLVIEQLKNIENKFNIRWENTPTWCFKIQIFSSPFDVGKEIIDRIEDEELDIDEELGMTTDEWLSVCKDIYQAEDHKEIFINELRERCCV